MDINQHYISVLEKLQRTYNLSLFLCGIILIHRILWYSNPEGGLKLDQIPIIGIKLSDQSLLIAFILVMALAISVWVFVHTLIWKKFYINDVSVKDRILPYIPGVLVANRWIKGATIFYLFSVVSVVYNSTPDRPDIPFLFACLGFLFVLIAPLLTINKKALLKLS